MINKKKILITGAAGFIGFHLVKKMTSMGFQVVGIDNLNPNYDKKIKNDTIKFLNAVSIEHAAIWYGFVSVYWG